MNLKTAMKWAVVIIGVALVLVLLREWLQEAENLGEV